MLSEKLIVYLLLIEVFVLILILGITRGEDLAVALGTISMALAIVYIEIIKPWLHKPKIKIEFKNGKEPVGIYSGIPYINNEKSDCSSQIEKLLSIKNLLLTIFRRKIDKTRDI